MAKLNALCTSGISGNMMIGALLDFGVPLTYLEDRINKLGLTGYRFIYKKVNKRGVSATYFDVILDKDTPSLLSRLTLGLISGHSQHRGYLQIKALIENTDLSPWVKEKAVETFYNLGLAEAEVHGSTLEQVHFHEVGAVDCIIDIVGTMLCLEYLGVTEIKFSPLHVGKGKVRCAHGILNVPTPATANLLRGMTTYTTDIVGELVTPTGAALAKTLQSSGINESDGFLFGVGNLLGKNASDWQRCNKIFESLYEDSKACGVGAGGMELDIPNVLRVFK